MPKPQHPLLSPEPLVEGVDYYVEGGYWVFTAHYLRKRGYCCGSGCRHCPYRKQPDKGSAEGNEISEMSGPT